MPITCNLLHSACACFLSILVNLSCVTYFLFCFSVQPETRSCVKAGRTNTYPKLPEKFRVRTADVEPERVPTQNTEEEVIFF